MLLNEQGVQECFTTAARTCVARGPTPSTLYGSSSAAVRDEPSSTSRSKRLRNHILLQIWLLSNFIFGHTFMTRPARLAQLCHVRNIRKKRSTRSISLTSK